MSKVLTLSEKRSVKKFLEESKALDSKPWPEWAAWILIGIGGFMLVLTCLTALNNLGAPSIENMFFIGVVAGMFLVVIGAYGTHKSNKIEEKIVLSRALKKLLA